MNEIDDRLEILIGKFLDGEISLEERQWLERELDANAQARELLDQLRNLRRCSRDAIAAEAFLGGASADDIFDRAWQQNAKPSERRIFKIGGALRFAAGIAAGLVLAMMVNHVLDWSAKPSVPTSGGRQVVQDTRAGMGGQPAVGPVVVSQSPDRVKREVEWYVFTDEDGQQWLVQGIRENTVQPASYSGQLH